MRNNQQSKPLSKKYSLGAFTKRLPKLRWYGGSSVTKWLACKTVSHWRAVGWVTPQSAAKLLRLSNWPLRAAHMATKV